MYLPEGSDIICSMSGASFLAKTMSPFVCEVPGEMMISPSYISFMLSKEEMFVCVSWRIEKSAPI